MKAIFKLWIVVVLLALGPSRCLASRDVAIISINEAKELGLELRATPAGPTAAWLELEFKTEGKLKDYSPGHSFSRVELEIRDGTKPLVSYAVLREQHPKPGHVRVRFMANRAYLDKLVLTIVVGDGLLPGGAFEVPVKEFVDPAKIR